MTPRNNTNSPCATARLARQCRRYQQSHRTNSPLNYPHPPAQTPRDPHSPIQILLPIWLAREAGGRALEQAAPVTQQHLNRRRFSPAFHQNSSHQCEKVRSLTRPDLDKIGTKMDTIRTKTGQNLATFGQNSGLTSLCLFTKLRKSDNAAVCHCRLARQC